MPDTRPPQGAREEARRGLAWRQEYGRGGTAVGVARARDISNGASLSRDTIARMVSYFARHEVDKQGEGWSPGEDGYPSAGRIAWALWGGDPGRRWAETTLEQLDMNNDDRFAPVDGLTRSAPLDFTVERDDSGDGLTLDGYAAVFDSPTEINNHEGAFVETIAPGAFRKTLREGRPVLQFDHGKHPMIGSLPIGKIETLREDDHGLHVRARLHSSDLFAPVREAIASGAIGGMSFRFSVVQEDWTDPKSARALPQRTVREVKLYELGPVVWPAYAATSVGVRDVDTTGTGWVDAQGASLEPVAVTDPTEPLTHSADLLILRHRLVTLARMDILR